MAQLSSHWTDFHTVGYLLYFILYIFFENPSSVIET